jgi:hypothetical protein
MWGMDIEQTRSFSSSTWALSATDNHATITRYFARPFAIRSCVFPPIRE